MTTPHSWEKELQICTPWTIDSVSYTSSKNQEQKEIHIFLSYKRGAHFGDETGTPCPVYNTYTKTWRHRDQDEHPCFVHCKVPRIQTTEGKVKLITVPWARFESKFTLGFEAYVLHLLKQGLPLTRVCTAVHETRDRIFVIFNHWVTTAYASQHVDQNLDSIGLDKHMNNTKNRQNTLLVDLRNQRVLFVAEGKGQEVLHQIKTYLENKDINPVRIKQLCADLFDPLWTTTLKTIFPLATVYYDRFYVIQHLNEALDQVCAIEQKMQQIPLTQQRLFRTDLAVLTEKQKTRLLQLMTQFPRIETAYRLTRSFTTLWEQPLPQTAETFLDAWCLRVEKTSLAPFKKFVQTIKKNKQSILDWNTLPSMDKTVLEDIHKTGEQLKSHKSGLRNIENFSNMIYLLCGKLSFPAFQEDTDEIS